MNPTPLTSFDSSLWTDPPVIYRGAPFWSWNAELEADRLCRAIEQMHEAGMGGFFMHSRDGLKTPFLGEKWFECVRACVEQARQLGMKAYLYDEDRWPSGSGGGFATREHIEYRTRSLLVSEAGDEGGELLAAFEIEMDERGRLVSYRPCALEARPRDGQRIVHFSVCVGSENGWFNAGAYLDTMNPEAVDEFIRVAYQSYADRFGEDFGGVIPAMFTDEPSFGPTMDNFSEPARPISRLSWTRWMTQEFKKLRGYDLTQHLPELAFPLASGAFSRVRYDYHRTLTELFVENYSGRIGRWCRKNNIALTGHVLREETLLSQTLVDGACMPHYFHMDWPGIDALGDQTEQLSSAKQVTSVAAQFGKARVLTELYGATGWDWPLEGHKFIGDWQYACGVNFRCHHLTHYSLAGAAKRDYPASIFKHSPWWLYYKPVEDYFARLSAVLSQGQPIRDILMVHPIESSWGLCRSGNKEQEPLLGELDESFQALMRGLMEQHRDYDLGDESLMAGHAKVEAAELVVGRMRYKLVVVPPCVTLRQSTLKLLEAFQQAGGSVVFVGRLPQRMEGDVSEAASPLFEKAHRCRHPEELPAVLDELLPRKLSIREESQHEADFVWALNQQTGEGQWLFVQSHDRRQARRIVCRLATADGGPVILWDAMTGRRFTLPVEWEGDTARFELTLEPSGSALVSFGLTADDAPPLAAPPTVTDVVELAGPFTIDRNEPNVLPLDYVSFAAEGEEFSEPFPALAAEQRIRDRFGLPARQGYVCQPWYLYATGVIDTAERGRFQLKRTFHVTDRPSFCRLAIERPEDFNVTLNGRRLGRADGWWIDEDIRTIEVTGFLRKGENVLVQEFDYRADMELEPLWLIGDFGTTSLDGQPPRPGHVTLIKAERSLGTGWWVDSGLQFYGGSISYRIKVNRPVGQRVRLSLPEASATAIVVQVNQQTRLIPWKPWRIELTDALHEGQNEVSVEVIGGRKNSLGPLHTPWSLYTGPGSFDPAHPAWRAEYCLSRHGLGGPVRIEYLS